MSVEIDGGDVVLSGGGVRSIRLDAGQHQLRPLLGDQAGPIELVEVVRDGKQVVHAYLEGDKPRLSADGAGRPLVEPSYSVLGAVTRPGDFPITGDESVLDAIERAGPWPNGLPDGAYLARRDPTGGPDQRLRIDWDRIQQGDTTTNYQIQPGDRIVVPGGQPTGSHRPPPSQEGTGHPFVEPSYSVLGAVDRPSDYPITGDESVLDAIERAGPGPNGLPDGAYLSRRDPSGGPDQRLRIELDRIQRDRTTTNYHIRPGQLKPGDRIVFPGGQPKGLRRPPLLQTEDLPTLPGMGPDEARQSLEAAHRQLEEAKQALERLKAQDLESKGRLAKSLLQVAANSVWIAKNRVQMFEAQAQALEAAANGQTTQVPEAEPEINPQDSQSPQEAFQSFWRGFLVKKPESSNVKAHDEAEFQVKVPRLTARLAGPDRMFSGDGVSYVLTVTNTGNAPAKGVVVAIKIPESGKPLSAKPDGMSYDSRRRTFFWRLDHELPPHGASESFRVAVLLGDVGNLTITGGVQAEDIKMMTDTHTTQIENPQDFRFDVRDLKADAEESNVQPNTDEVPAAEETPPFQGTDRDVVGPRLIVTMQGPKIRFPNTKGTYVLTVTNTGAAPAKYVEAAIKIPTGGAALYAEPAENIWDKNRRTLYWRLDHELPPHGASEIFKVTARMLNVTDNLTITGGAKAENFDLVQDSRTTEVVAMPEDRSDPQIPGAVSEALADIEREKSLEKSEAANQSVTQAAVILEQLRNSAAPQSSIDKAAENLASALAEFRAAGLILNPEAEQALSQLSEYSQAIKEDAKALQRLPADGRDPQDPDSPAEPVEGETPEAGGMEPAAASERASSVARRLFPDQRAIAAASRAQADRYPLIRAMRERSARGQFPDDPDSRAGAVIYREILRRLAASDTDAVRTGIPPRTGPSYRSDPEISVRLDALREVVDRINHSPSTNAANGDKVRILKQLYNCLQNNFEVVWRYRYPEVNMSELQGLGEFGPLVRPADSRPTGDVEPTQGAFRRDLIEAQRRLRAGDRRNQGEPTTDTPDVPREPEAAVAPSLPTNRIRSEGRLPIRGGLALAADPTGTRFVVVWANGFTFYDMEARFKVRVTRGGLGERPQSAFAPDGGHSPLAGPGRA